VSIIKDDSRASARLRSREAIMKSPLYHFSCLRKFLDTSLIPLYAPRALYHSHDTQSGEHDRKTAHAVANRDFRYTCNHNLAIMSGTNTSILIDLWLNVVCSETRRVSRKDAVRSCAQHLREIRSRLTRIWRANRNADSAAHLIPSLSLSLSLSLSFSLVLLVSFLRSVGS
jgi:hypothetical protein